MGPLARRTRFLDELDTCWVGSHFMEDQTDITFVDTVTDSGTVLMGDDPNGLATLTPSDGTVGDNDEVYLASANANFKYGTNREIYGRCRLSWTETAAGVYNVGFGFQNAVGANTLIDDGGGPKVSGSTLAIYKVDGGTVWKCASACNGTSTVSTSTTSAVGSTYYDLEILCENFDGVSMEVAFKVDGQFLKDTNGVIRHTVAIASAAAMQLWVGAKLGAATNNDTTLVDYLYGHQSRV